MAYEYYTKYTLFCVFLHIVKGKYCTNGVNIMQRRVIIVFGSRINLFEFGRVFVF